MQTNAKMRYLTILFVILFLKPELYAQLDTTESPFVRLSVEEIKIDPAARAALGEQLADPAAARCWRIYAVLDEPDWELQAIAGGDGTLPPWTLNSDTHRFYQSSVGGITPTAINPSLYPLFPAVRYDSWFTIAAADNSASMNLLSFEHVSPDNLLTQWNTRGGDFAAGPAPYGCAITSALSYPSTQAMPDKKGKILIGQFTSDGPVSGIFNLQFRKLDGEGNILMPVTIAYTQEARFNTEKERE